MTSEDKEIIRQIKKYPYKIAKAVGFKDVREYPHNEWMKEIIFGKEDYTLLAHRGSYKSSILSVCLALIMVFNPFINIIFLRKTDKDVNAMITMVDKALQTRTLQNLSNIIWGTGIAMVKSTADTITTNLYDVVSGEQQLLGLGLKTSITGKHSFLVVTDDICNVDDRLSRAERDRTKSQFMELENICNRNQGGRIISIGTKWHKDDVFTLAKNIHTYTYKDTGLISDEKIQDLKDRMTPSLFACNYELKIIPDDEIMFTEPVTGAETAKVLNGIAHVDAAYGGEDYTAFTIGKIHDGKFYVYGRMWHKHIDDVMSEIVMLYENFLCGKMYTEYNADKGYSAKELRNRGVRVSTYNEKTNKYIKIASHLKFNWKDVIFVEGTDDSYINQICDYNENAEHDDAPDSLASLIRVLAPKKGRDENPESYMFL